VCHDRDGLQRCPNVRGADDRLAPVEQSAADAEHANVAARVASRTQRQTDKVPGDEQREHAVREVQSGAGWIEGWDEVAVHQRPVLERQTGAFLAHVGTDDEQRQQPADRRDGQPEHPCVRSRRVRTSKDDRTCGDESGQRDERERCDEVSGDDSRVQSRRHNDASEQRLEHHDGDAGKRQIEERRFGSHPTARTDDERHHHQHDNAGDRAM
jgi:hypothetical protein